MSEKKAKRQGIEFSKLIVFITGFLFIAAVLDVIITTKSGFDTSAYATQIIITTGGIFGASIIFYLNKAKIENLSKGKIRFALLRLRLEIKLKDIIPAENYEEVIEELNELDSMLDNKLDGVLEDAISQEVDVQSYY